MVADMSLTLDPGAVIARALDIYRQNFVVLFWSAALILIAPFVIAALLNNTTGGGIASLLTVILGSFYQGMVMELVQDVVEDGHRDHTIGQLFAGVAPVVLTLLVVSFLAWVGIGIGLLVIIVPGLFLMTMWAVTAPVVVMERTGVFAAFTRSQELVRGNLLPVFTVVLVSVVGIEIIRTIVQVLTDGLGTGASAVVTWAVAVATEPLSALAVAVLYYALLERQREA
jgi:hypothetical protein